MPLITDITSQSYNSYMSLEQADECVLSLNGYYDISSWTALETATSSVSSLVVLNGVATATTTEENGFASGDNVIIDGADNVALNGSHSVLVSSPTTFTFTTLEPDETATGTIIAVDESEKLDNDSVKENLIIGATKDMNNFDFVGALNSSVTSRFNMKWPRSGAYYSNGVQIGSDEIPSFACCYIAERIIEKQAQEKDGSFYDGRLKRQKVGDLEQEFHSATTSTTIKNNLKNNSSFECIRAYVINASRNMRFLTRA